MAAVLAKDHNTFGSKIATRTAVAPNTLHVVVLLSYSSDDVPAYWPPSSETKQHINTLAARFRAVENLIGMRLRDVQQGVLWQWLFPVNPMDGLLA